MSFNTGVFCGTFRVSRGTTRLSRGTGVAGAELDEAVENRDRRSWDAAAFIGCGADGAAPHLLLWGAATGAIGRFG